MFSDQELALLEQAVKCKIEQQAMVKTEVIRSGGAYLSAIMSKLESAERKWYELQVRVSAVRAQKRNGSQ